MQPHGLLGLPEHQKVSGEYSTKNNPLKPTPTLITGEGKDE